MPQKRPARSAVTDQLAERRRKAALRFGLSEEEAEKRSEEFGSVLRPNEEAGESNLPESEESIQLNSDETPAASDEVREKSVQLLSDETPAAPDITDTDDIREGRE